jgi:hypothetical protein
LTEFIAAVVSLVVLVLSPAITAYIKVRLSPQQLQLVSGLASATVSAAEEAGHALKLGGPEKYHYAQTALESAARRVGVKLKPEETNAFIHAALAQLKEASGGFNEGLVAGYQAALDEAAATIEDKGDEPSERVNLPA